MRTLAYHKYNQFQLYTEHTFAFPRHPAIGADAGALTPDDILALDAICRAHHVDLVPNLQSLGHQRALLNLPQYEHLAETTWKWSLATADDETFRFLDELYGDLLPAFSSRFFNVDADEPWDMGRGRSRALTEEVGVGRVYLHHIKRLHELVTKHGRQMMMWADVFWHHPDLVGELPEDVVLLDWWYERKDHHDTVDVIANAGRRFYVCPGTSSWSSLFPRLDNAIANIRTYVRDGVATGAEGMLLTDWGDNGHYQQLSGSWYPYLWGAECAWTGGTTESEHFDAAFGRLFLGDGSGAQVAALRRLGSAMQTAPGWWRSWNSALALFEEPLTGDLVRFTSEQDTARARDAALAIFPLLGQIRDPGLRHDLGFTAAQIVFASDKLETTRVVRTLLVDLAANPGPTDQGRGRLDALVATMRRQRETLLAMAAEFERRWLAHARPSQIGVTLDRFAGLIARYDAAIAWLEAQRAAYLDGRGVDATLATYDDAGYAVLYHASMRDIRDLADVVGPENLPPDVRGWLEAADAEAAEARPA
ncbi:MAG: family 20 glycosylhydrolase [Chloroflexota bacterium]|nr:family 20 glycosylhydrolase [Chloroflexota bacterium]